MATTTGIKFHKKQYASITDAKTAATGGAIVFDTASQTIFVDGKQYGGLVDATFANNVLTITKANSTTPVTLNFSTLATAESVMHAFQELHTEVDAIETGAGLGENGAYTAPTGTNYLGNATSLKNADTLLDAAIKAVDNKVDGINGAVQSISLNNVLLTEDSDHDVTIATNGTYDADTNKIATEYTVSSTIDSLEGSHDVATGAAYTAQTGEHAAYKIDLFDATETDGKVTTNNAAADTIYFSAQPTATNPVITYNDISGLSGAMHYRGEVAADPTTTAPSGTFAAGDVVTNGNVEYVYNGSAWRVLGDEGSYALKTTTVTGTNGLTGGGALSSNQTISHATQTTGATTGTAVTSGSVNVVTGITTDTYAHVTSVEKTSVTLPTVNNATLTLAGATSGPITVSGSKTDGAATFSANDSTANTITITHAAAPTTGTPAAIKVAVDSYGHVKAGSAIVASEIGFTAPTGMTADDVQGAIEEVNTKVTNANITIDGHKGAITTGNGLTAVAADGGSFAVKLDSSNANGLSVGANGIAMAKATGSTFGTVEVTAGNGLTLTDGVVAYAHNTSAITVASKDTDTNIITINGTLTPDTSDAITTSNAITLAAVAATGAATNMTVTSATYGGSTATTNLQTALTNLSSAVSTSTAVVDGTETISVNDSSSTVIATVGGHDISTKVAFYWEEYA